MCGVWHTWEQVSEPHHQRVFFFLKGKKNLVVRKGKKEGEDIKEPHTSTSSGGVIIITAISRRNLGSQGALLRLSATWCWKK